MASVQKPKGKPGAPKGNTNGKGNAGKARRTGGPGQPGGALILTRKIGTEICERVAKGVPKTYAARASGVAPNTLLEWERRGRGDDDRPATELTIWFAAEMERAVAKFVETKIVEISTDEDWHAKAWMLERRFPEEFGRPADRVEITGQGGGEIVIRMRFDDSPLPARTRAELGGPVIDVDGEELP